VVGIGDGVMVCGELGSGGGVTCALGGIMSTRKGGRGKGRLEKIGKGPKSRKDCEVGEMRRGPPE
jgi:hypothetical protein